MLPQAPPGRWRQLLGDPAVTMLVADESDPRPPGRLRQGEPGELLGFTACGASRDPDAGPNAGEIRTFFVAARSWRRGVGRELMAAALADLAGTGYTEATVWSFAANRRANAFYEAHGFMRNGAERTEAAWAHLPEVRYRRPAPLA